MRICHVLEAEYVIDNSMVLTPVLETFYFLFWWNKLYYYGGEVRTSSSSIIRCWYYSRGMFSFDLIGYIFYISFPCRTPYLLSDLELQDPCLERERENVKLEWRIKWFAIKVAENVTVNSRESDYRAIILQSLYSCFDIAVASQYSLDEIFSGRYVFKVFDKYNLLKLEYKIYSFKTVDIIWQLWDVCHLDGR
jgi:hypothetical protein